MSIKKELEEVQDGLEANRLESKVAAQSIELTAAKTLIRTLRGEVDRLERVHDFLGTPLDQEPEWCKMPKKVKSTQKRGTVVFMISDLHLDEIVDPTEMRGRNAYNREIAEARLQRAFQGAVEQTTFYHQGTKYDGCIVLLGGDLVSGQIHEELRETNEVPVPATIRHWTPKLASGLALLADTFGSVHVAAVPGNHGRFSQRPRYKKRAFDNADWLISALLAERLAGDSRFTFDVPNALDTAVSIYGHTLLLTHGDQAGGGAGIAGIFPPIMRLRARKQANFAFDWLALGHFHQYVHSQGITINGSLKGYDEYALGNNFLFEEPKQALWIVTPEHGVTWPVEVLVSNRKSEGW